MIGDHDPLASKFEKLTNNLLIILGPGLLILFGAIALWLEITRG